MSFLDLANPEILEIAPYQPGKPISEVQRELGIKNVIKLASNENPLGPSPKALSAINQALSDLALYPDSNGYELKQAIAQKWQIQPNQITLGAGSEALFVLIGQAFVKSGQEVLVSQYGFATFAIATHIFQGKLITIPANHWGHDLEATLKAVTAQTRLIFLANPNNPTAAWHDHASLVDFFERLPPHIIVVLDEAYAEFMTHEKNYPNSRQLLTAYPNIIITRTFSKLHGLAGLRIGYAVSHPAAAEILNRVRLPFNVGSLSMSAALAALDDNEHIAATLKLAREGLAYFEQAFNEMQIKFLPPAGNFITIDLERNAMPVYESLLHEGIIVRPLAANYGLPNFLRISVGTMEQNQRLTKSLCSIA
ncbi:MAG: histidinol-phosphate transaminase [Gammaproteobacteria bacterium]|nr:histidinol-phosphate transaminase [Gammaproteobacteria bacterium]